MCGGVAVEIVKGGELGCAGLDGVPGLAQEQADVADVAADVFVPDVVQGGDGPVGQAVAVVQDGGDELVGEGDPGVAAVAGQLAGAVAAAAVQGGVRGAGRLARSGRR